MYQDLSETKDTKENTVFHLSVMPRQKQNETVRLL